MKPPSEWRPFNGVIALRAFTQKPLVRTEEPVYYTKVELIVVIRKKLSTHDLAHAGDSWLYGRSVERVFARGVVLASLSSDGLFADLGPDHCW